jgi:hypothetical protein
MAFRTFATLVAMLICAGVAAAQDFCGDSMSHEEFIRLLRTSAKPASVGWPDGVFPLGHPMDIAVSTPDHLDLLFRVFAARPGIDEPPVEVDIAHVSRNDAADITNIRLFLDLSEEDAEGNPDPNRASAVHHRPLFLARMSFVVIGCESGAGASLSNLSDDDVERLVRAGALPGDLKVWATTDRAVSTTWMGIATATLAFFIAVGAAYLAASHLGRKKAEKLGEEPSKSERRGFKALFVDFRNRVSLSNFQIFVFFTVVFVAVAYVFGRTRELSDLSEDVLLLLGISAVGGIAGKLADVKKNRLSWDNWSWLKFDVEAFSADEEAKPSWWQLVSTQGEFDIYRFQALAFTLLVAPAFVVMSLYTLGEANIPPGILAVLGLSQATYIGGKLAIQPTLEEFDGKVTKMRDRWFKGPPMDKDEAKKFANEFEAALDLKPSDKMVRNLENRKPHMPGSQSNGRAADAPAPDSATGNDAGDET